MLLFPSPHMYSLISREHAKAWVQPARPFMVWPLVSSPQFISSPPLTMGIHVVSGELSSAHTSSALHFSSRACSCWKKLSKPFWVLSGLPEHPLGTKRAKIKHSELFKRIKFTLALSAHTPWLNQSYTV